MTQTSTNRAQTNGTGLERFGQHGVESDVTAQNCFCYFYEGEIYLTFISTAQISTNRALTNDTSFV